MRRELKLGWRKNPGVDRRLVLKDLFLQKSRHPVPRHLSQQLKQQWRIEALLMRIAFVLVWLSSVLMSQQDVPLLCTPVLRCIFCPMWVMGKNANVKKINYAILIRINRRTICDARSLPRPKLDEAWLKVIAAESVLLLLKWLRIIFLFYSPLDSVHGYITR